MLENLCTLKGGPSNASLSSCTHASRGLYHIRSVRDGSCKRSTAKGREKSELRFLHGAKANSSHAFYPLLGRESGEGNTPMARKKGAPRPTLRGMQTHRRIDDVEGKGYMCDEGTAHKRTIYNERSARKRDARPTTASIRGQGGAASDCEECTVREAHETLRYRKSCVRFVRFRMSSQIQEHSMQFTASVHLSRVGFSG